MTMTDSERVKHRAALYAKENRVRVSDDMLQFLNRLRELKDGELDRLTELIEALSVKLDGHIATGFYFGYAAGVLEHGRGRR